MNENKKKFLLNILDIVANVVFIFILVLIIQRWIVAPFDVSGSSMCNTLNYLEEKCVGGKGEKIIINEALYLFNDPERGDIVVFKATEQEEKFLIKRVIGLPGDKIEIKDGEIHLTPAGENSSYILDEPYLNQENIHRTQEHIPGINTFEVPEDSYFLLGDNRKASTDSRSCFASTLNANCKLHPEEAFIQKSEIRGKAWVVWWPFNSMRTIKHQEYSKSLEEK